MNSNIQFYMNGIVGLPSNGLDLLAFLTNYPDYHHVGLVQVHPSRANKWRQMRNMSIIRETPAGKASGIPYYSAANWESTLGDENANNESHVWRHQKHQELLLAFNILIFSLWGLSPTISCGYEHFLIARGHWPGPSILSSPIEELQFVSPRNESTFTCCRVPSLVTSSCELTL